MSRSSASTGSPRSNGQASSGLERHTFKARGIPPGKRRPMFFSTAQSRSAAKGVAVRNSTPPRGHEVRLEQ
eukprot:4232993-Alexandrium_andersonii.AAC.1